MEILLDPEGLDLRAEDGHAAAVPDPVGAVDEVHDGRPLLLRARLARDDQKREKVPAVAIPHGAREHAVY